MNSNTILVTTSSFGASDPAPLEKMRRLGLNVVINPYGRKLSEEEVQRLLKDYRPVGLVAGVEPLSDRVLQNAPCLKIISRCGIGMDSVDLKAANRLGIVVTNTPDAPTIPVAELTLGMILGLLRGIHIADASVRKDKWDRPMGRLLYAKTIGIVGCGRIGRRLAHMLKGFNCTVIGYDQADLKCSDLQLVGLEQLMKTSDIISLHIPYSDQTHHFVNGDRIALMKKGSYLINAARGGLVDESELYRALSEGHLAGAALDCFEQEPYKGPFQELRNVLLTTHIGSYAREGRIMMESQAVENLIQALKEKGLIS
jgi:D-3-phosphoglycerate dehydrogenase